MYYLQMHVSGKLAVQSKENGHHDEHKPLYFIMHTPRSQGKCTESIKETKLIPKVIYGPVVRAH